MKIEKPLLAVMVCTLLISCKSNTDSSELDRLQASVDSLQQVTSIQAARITRLRDSVTLLSYPAADRMAHIRDLIASEEYTSAKSEIAQLREVFPLSSEAKASDELETQIDKQIAAKQAELERIKALGFKGLKAQTTFSVGYNTLTLSAFSIGKTFTFDSYGDRYYYATSDKGNKYVTSAMSIKSSEKDPKIPQLALYSIHGEHMRHVANFRVRYARWRDYGAFLGNYSDDNNDFAKVNTVRFKLGVEVSEEITSGAFAIVCKRSNDLSSSYNRFDNPPMSWVGTADYPAQLSLTDFEQEYILVKLYNL